MTMEAQRAQNPAQLRQDCLDQLELLAEALAGRSLRARLVTPPGRLPSLHAVNPEAPALAEDIYAGPCRDSGWWFWWSWAERIATCEDVEGAALQISRVLAARPETGPVPG
jgi:hypothetical protein